MQKYHVLVEWPQGQPWLVLIEATDAEDARRVVEESDDVQRGAGRVAAVQLAKDA